MRGEVQRLEARCLAAEKDVGALRTERRVKEGERLTLRGDLRELEAALLGKNGELGRLRLDRDDLKALLRRLEDSFVKLKAGIPRATLEGGPYG